MHTVRVVGYVRVSTGEQAQNGSRLAAQEAAIEAEAERRGWQLAHVYRDAGVSGRSLDGRPALSAALSAVEAGRADGLVVARIDRLSRSLSDFATLVERSRRRGWVVLAPGLGVDTSSPSGEMLANVLAVFAQFERRLIGQRTREALAVRRSQGVRLGRPRSISADVRDRIIRERNAGETFQAIADQLNASGIAPARGGRAWYATTVRRVVRADAEAAPG